MTSTGQLGIYAGSKNAEDTKRMIGERQLTLSLGVLGPLILPDDYLELPFEEKELGALERQVKAVIPALAAQVSAGSRHALDRLREDVAAGKTDRQRIARRLETLIRLDGVPVELALHAVAQGAAQRGRNYEEIWEAMFGTLTIRKIDKLEFQPSYGAGEFERLVFLVQQGAGNRIVVTRDRKFRFDGEVISNAEMSAAVRRALLVCEVWDYRRAARIDIDTRLVREVLSALRDTCNVTEAAITGSPMEEFYERRLVLLAQVCTPTADIWKAWIAEQGDRAGDKRHFSKMLMRWAKGRVVRCKPIKLGQRVPCYRGVALRR